MASLLVFVAGRRWHSRRTSHWGSDEKGAYVAERMVTMGDVFATIYKPFGIDWEKTVMTPIGRPIKIANSIEDKTGVPGLV